MLASVRASGPRLPSGRSRKVDAIRLPVRRCAPTEAERLPIPPGRRTRRRHRPAAAGLAVLVVDEHQVDVAGVIQLLAAELAEADDGEPGRPAAFRHRVAIPSRQLPQRMLNGDFNGHFRRSADRARDFFERPVANHVGDADPEHLSPAESAEGPQDADLVGRGVDRTAHCALDRSGEERASARRATANQVDRVRVSGQHVGEKLAGTEQPEQGVQGSAATFDQRRQLGPTGRLGEQTLEVIQRQVRIGRPRQPAGQRRHQIEKRFWPEVVGEGDKIAAATVQVADRPGRWEARRIGGHKIILSRPPARCPNQRHALAQADGSLERRTLGATAGELAQPFRQPLILRPPTGELPAYVFVYNTPLAAAAYRNTALRLDLSGQRKMSMAPIPLPLAGV